MTQSMRGTLERGVEDVCGLAGNVAMIWGEEGGLAYLSGQVSSRECVCGGGGETTLSDSRQASAVVLDICGIEIKIFWLCDVCIKAREKCDICAVNKFSTFHADST